MSHLQKLLASNRQRAPHLAQSKIVASADETTIYLYDAIVSDEETAQWWGGVSAEALVPEIRAIKTGVIHLRINSPGGDVFAAQAIAAAIRDTGAKVIAHVDGYAASAATTIATAADEVEMADGSFYMIHNAWTWAMGNANELSATVALLQKLDGDMARQYAAKSGKTPEEVRAMMDEETWFTAQEAVDAGLADRVSQSTKAKATWNMSAYAKAPKIEAPAVDDSATEEHRDRQQQRLRMMARVQIG